MKKIVINLSLSLSFLLSAQSAFAENSSSKADIPTYEQSRPKWGFGISGGTNAGSNQSLSTQNGEEVIRVNHFDLNIEYQPVAIQDIGVIGIGGTFGMHPYYTEDVDRLAVSVGGLVRYQARFFEGQVLVPVVGFAVERWKTSYENLGFMAAGPLGGVWLYLSGIDKRAANSLYRKYGVSRTYIVAEVKSLGGGTDETNETGGRVGDSIEGESYHAGFRLEF
jgi:hypothetical protein